MGAGGTVGRAAGAAAATFATGWAVANNKVPPATGIIPYAVLEAAAELKVKTERRVFEGSNVALGVLLLPFHVLSCGLRALGWARVVVRGLPAQHVDSRTRYACRILPVFAPRAFLTPTTPTPAVHLRSRSRRARHHFAAPATMRKRNVCALCSVS